MVNHKHRSLPLKIMTSRKSVTYSPLSPRIALAIAIGIFIAQAIAFSGFTIDDAFITFAYPKNLIQGDGLVFARGVNTEATSSMLWAVLLAPFELIIPQGAVLGSKLLGVTCSLLTIVTGFFLITHLLPGSQRRNALVIYSFSIAVASPFVTWSVYGMENPLVALLLMLGVLLFLIDEEKGTWGSALVVFLLQAVRPEGFIYVLIFGAFKLLLALISRNRKHLKSALIWLLILGICVAAYEAWGYLYYGHLLPNTVKAKVDGLSFNRIKSGLSYATYGINGLFSLTLIAAVQLSAIRLLVFRPAKWNNYLVYIKQNQGEILMGVLLVAQWSFVISAGGDWMANGRLFSHALPLLVVYLIVSTSQLIALTSYHGEAAIMTKRVMLANLLVIYLAADLVYTRSTYAWQKNLQESEERALVGMVHYLNQLPNSENALLAASDVGRPGYMFKGRVLDWWGLADEEIATTGQAQGRIKASTVLKRKPDYIILYSTEPDLRSDTMEENMAVFSRPFFDSPEFAANYTQIKSLRFWDKRWHVLFERKKPGV